MLASDPQALRGAILNSVATGAYSGQSAHQSAQQSRLSASVSQALDLHGSLVHCLDILSSVHAALVGHGAILPKNTSAGPLNVINAPQPVTGLIDDLQVALMGSHGTIADVRATAEAIKALVSR